MRRVLSLILGGGRGTRLAPLTTERSKPAVPIGGKYRLIDIPISNCLNSNVRKIFVLTQFNSESLHRHIFHSYKFDRFSHGFLEILAASQSTNHTDWYQGTADAVRQSLNHFESVDFDEYLILAGDHLYRMNYSEFVMTHRNKKADLTVSVKPVTREEASEFGILKVDEAGRIVKFAEKPTDDDLLDELMSDTGDPERPFWGSMGIYVFKRKVLNKVLGEIKEEDFGKHIIPGSIKAGKNVFAHFFKGYWEDIGTIKAFYDTNIALTQMDPPFHFINNAMPIYTHARMLPGTRINVLTVERSLINEGCKIQADSIMNSVIGIRSVICKGSKILNSYIMGNDFYEGIYHDQEVPLGIGENCYIKNAIIDKNARIGNNVHIENAAGIMEEIHDNYCIHDGIVVLKKNAVIPDNTVI